MKKIFALALFCIFLPFSAMAEKQTSCNQEETAELQIQCEYNTWLQEASIKTTNPSDFNNMIAFGDATVIPSQIEDWAQSRSSAYEEALITAYAKVASELNSSIKLETTSEFVSSPDTLVDKENSYPKTFTEKSKHLINKTITWLEKKLDKEIKELDVSSTPSQEKQELQKDLYKKSINTEAVITAIAETTGMIPLMTFEATDTKGTTIIRVVISKSPKRVALIKAMLNNSHKLPPIENKKSALSIKEQIIKSPKEMMHQYGTRLIYDEEGYPVLVSFGQASYIPSSNNIEETLKKENALNSATTYAETSMTFLLNQTTIYEKTTQKLAEIYKKQTLTKSYGQALISETTGSNYKEQINTKAKANSFISEFTGMTTLHQWTHKDPNTNNFIVGVVKIWSPKTAKNSFNIKNLVQEEKQENTTSTTTQPTNNIPVGITRSMETDDYDF